MTTFTALDGPSNLISARPGPDLAAAGYSEAEYVVRGTAPSYAGEIPPDGRWALTARGEAEFATRCVVRRPAEPAAFSGTVVVEWLNVSSGSDAAPDWTYLSDEIVRRGHVWAGVSAQYVGVEGGTAAMCYVFRSLAANRVLRPGDTIALGTPIFTPYIELPALSDFGLETVSVDQDTMEDGRHSWQYSDAELRKLEDPKVKAFFIVNPSNPASFASRKACSGSSGYTQVVLIPMRIMRFRSLAPNTGPRVGPVGHC